jgi:hypothetical protein
LQFKLGAFTLLQPISQEKRVTVLRSLFRSEGSGNLVEKIDGLGRLGFRRRNRSMNLP